MKLYERFRQGLAANPDGVAVRLPDDRVLTYTDLERRSAQVSDRLRHLRPRRLAFCLRDPIDIYPVLLAASRLDAGFVPVDVDTAEAWRMRVLEVAAPDVVVVDAADDELGARLRTASFSPVAGVAPGEDPSAAALEVYAGPRTTRPGGGPGEAYVLFTSGSTGLPKGVPITTENLTAFLDAIRPLYELDVTDTVVQLHRFTFDMSVMEMAVAWTAGATLDLPGAWDYVALERYARRRRPTWLLITPSLAREVTRHRPIQRKDWESLRYLLFGGEALDAHTVEAWRGAAPSAVVDNYYGPTELSIACSMWRLAPGDPVPALPEGRVPIGHVFGGLEWEIDPVEGRPDGQGELLVAGPQVFPGYLGSAGGTREFTARSGKRFYRTGDLVERVEPYGFVHRGRIDSQVKHRGYRIDVTAVEAVLRSLPDVTDARVFVEKRVDRQSLVALLVGDASPAAVREAVTNVLPRYMVPDEAHVVEKILTNHNGKADLPATLRSARAQER